MSPSQSVTELHRKLSLAKNLPIIQMAEKYLEIY